MEPAEDLLAAKGIGPPFIQRIAVLSVMAWSVQNGVVSSRRARKKIANPNISRPAVSPISFFFIDILWPCLSFLIASLNDSDKSENESLLALDFQHSKTGMSR
jgi:hypothetical protein